MSSYGYGYGFPYYYDARVGAWVPVSPGYPMHSVYVGAGYVPGQLAWYAPFNDVINAHDDFWIRQPSTGSGAGSDWHKHRWMAFLNKWRSTIGQFFERSVNELIDLRREAAQLGIPVPRLGQSELERAIAQAIQSGQRFD